MLRKYVLYIDAGPATFFVLVPAKYMYPRVAAVPPTTAAAWDMTRSHRAR